MLRRLKVLSYLQLGIHPINVANRSNEPIEYVQTVLENPISKWERFLINVFFPSRVEPSTCEYCDKETRKGSMYGDRFYCKKCFNDDSIEKRGF